MTDHTIYAQITVHEAEDQQEAYEFLETLIETTSDYFTLESAVSNPKLLEPLKLWERALEERNPEAE